MANDSVVTQNTLQTFYNNKVYPYLNGATHTGCVPLGTVLPYYGETAPEHFLICDGTEYLKSDYGELATHLLSLTDPTPYQGSDADHFKVPDLRGEFLRGSGTNSHANQGSGGDVGEHQNATEHMVIDFNGSNKIFHIQNESSSGYNTAKNRDSLTTTASLESYILQSTGGTSAKAYYTSRPTNTSVTYIIAYQNAYIDLALDGFPIDITQPQDGQLLMYDATAGRWINGGHKYSTNEHIVGTWIDGKPIYEKTIVDTLTSSAGVIINIAHGISNLKKLISIKGLIYENNGSTGYMLPYKDNTNDIRVQVNESNLVYVKNGHDFDSGQLYVTFQYTKTTD